MRGLRLGLGIARGRGNSGPPVPAVITIVSVSTQESDGDVPVSYTIDKNDATVECVVFPAASGNPTAAQFNGGGAPTYVDQGTVSLTTSGSPINLTITGTFAGSVKLALLPTNGGDGDVVVSSAFTLDTTAPTISTLSPADGATAVSGTANLVMTFSEAMKTQGTVDLRVVGGALIESFDLATEGTWSSGDTVWTGNPASDFTAGASLCVRWSGLEDTKGNALANNTGDTLWNFGVAGGVTNLYTNTQAFDNAAWTKTDLTVTANATTDPFSGSNADRLVASAGSSSKRVGQAYGSATNGTSYTVSVYAKADEYTVLQIAASTGVSGANTWYVNYNLSTGAVGNSLGGTPSIEDVGSGWYRCIWTVTSATVGSMSLLFAIQTSGTATRLQAVSTTGGLFIHGAQLVVGTVPGNYTAN
jgi:hypothetical protein